MNTANEYTVPRPSLNEEEGLVSQVFELTPEAWSKITEYWSYCTATVEFAMRTLL